MHTSPRLLLDSLKRCPLCAAVNAEACDACFVCGWSGAFAHDAEGLQASFDDLVSKCPELMGLRSRPSWAVRLRKVFQRLRTLSASPDVRPF